MKNLSFLMLLLLFVVLIPSCANEETKQEVGNFIFQTEVKEMTDLEYPDNNDIESRCDDWEKYKHHKVSIERIDSNNFTIAFFPSNEFSDTLRLENLDLLTFIPTIPNYLEDDYLTSIGIINAEWNRQQVKFTEEEFYISKHKEEGRKTVRLDLARNCLNSYLWEIITYANEGGKQKPLYHGWFEFPRELYEILFDEVNEGRLTFSEYKEFLVNYKDLESEVVNLQALRTEVISREVPFSNLNNEFYPLTGARKSKYKNIVYPKNPISINDFLTDSTSFSTFLYPGYYSTSDPRATTLSKLRDPKNVTVKEVISNNIAKEKCVEIDVSFADGQDSTKFTRVVIGGVKLSQIPQLAISDYNNGFKMPMGIGTHAFYEPVADAQNNSSKTSPYYAFILDENSQWLDSHFFGIDGPILHLDDKDPNLLHYWLLSFERHAMVTHLTFKLG